MFPKPFSKTELNVAIKQLSTLASTYVLLINTNQRIIDSAQDYMYLRNLITGYYKRKNLKKGVFLFEEVVDLTDAFQEQFYSIGLEEIYLLRIMSRKTWLWLFVTGYYRARRIREHARKNREIYTRNYHKINHELDLLKWMAK